MLQAGEDLVRDLNRRKFTTKAAVWLYMEEPDEWRFGTPIDLTSMALVDTKDSLVKGLSRSLRARSGTAGMRLSHSIINGRFVEDAYIYRVAA